MTSYGPLRKQEQENAKARVRWLADEQKRREQAALKKAAALGKILGKATGGTIGDAMGRAIGAPLASSSEA